MVTNRMRLRKNKVSERWTPRLGEQFCPISSYFLANYHRLSSAPGQGGLKSTEAMLVIHLIDHKWDDRHPFPTIGKLATRLGVSTRHVRDTLRLLEQRSLVTRLRTGSNSGANRYDLTGLFAALEALMDADVAKDEITSAEAA